jgi:hypothetical protein
MNTTENKHLLWELTKDLYSSDLERERVIELFEMTVAEVDKTDAPLLEKNKRFLSLYIERIVRETRRPQEAILIHLSNLSKELREIKQELREIKAITSPQFPPLKS